VISPFQYPGRLSWHYSCCFNQNQSLYFRDVEWFHDKELEMTRTEAIKIARKLSTTSNPLSVIFDKDREDFFISESDIFFIDNDFYENQPYEIIAVFK